ncbi:NAD-binding protein [Alteromonas oceani]|uniref:NAD-binding protein n=1 Tax=Alteromonas oceani TaxID=2071609 RepID=A0ABV7JX91_9ALTE|nr:NAD-binding protein [Alteromonas oceani]
MSEQVAPSFFSPHERYSLIIVGVIAFMLGVHGYNQYFETAKQSATLLDSIYHAINLFLMQFAAKDQLPWSLELARWLAPVTLSYTLIKTILVLAKDSVHTIQIKKLKKHCVIVGLNKGSFELARSMVKHGIKPVVVDPNENNEYLGLLGKQKIYFVAANPSDPVILERINTVEASYLFAATNSDTTNLEVIHNAAYQKRLSSLNIVCKINNQSLVRALYNRPLFSVNHPNITTKIINSYKVTARWLLNEFGPDCLISDIAKRPCINIAIVGDTQLVDALVKRLVEIGIYGANTTLKISVLAIKRNASKDDEHSTLLLNEEKLEYLEIKKVYLKEPSIEDFDEQLCSSHLDCCYIAMHESDYALMALQSLLDMSVSCPMVVSETENNETFSWLASEFVDEKGIHFAKTHTVTNSFSSIFGEKHDLFARNIHEQYVAEQTGAGFTIKDNSSLVSWADLPETLKDANRNQADHISTKCRLLTGKANPEPLEMQNALTRENVEMLAQTEHLRWMAEKFLSGWRFTEGEKDAVKRLSPSLKPWHLLPESEKQKDRDAILHIPEMLKKMTSNNVVR